MNIQQLGNGYLALTNTNAKGELVEPNGYQKIWVPPEIEQLLMTAPMTPPLSPRFGELRDQCRAFCEMCLIQMIDVDESMAYLVQGQYGGTGVYGHGFSWRSSFGWNPRKDKRHENLLYIVERTLPDFPLVKNLVDLRSLQFETEGPEEASVELEWKAKSSPLFERFQKEMQYKGENHWGDLYESEDIELYADGR